jgi:hypothetical protein
MRIWAIVVGVMLAITLTVSDPKGAAWMLTPWIRARVALSERMAFNQAGGSVPASPPLVRLFATDRYYLWRRGQYHRIPNRTLLEAMGYQPAQAAVVLRLPRRLGHALTFYYDPKQPFGLWFHDDRFYPVQHYAPSAWLGWGHRIQTVPFEIIRHEVRLGASGPEPPVDRPAQAEVGDSAFRVQSIHGLIWEYPRPWTLRLVGHARVKASSQRMKRSWTIALIARQKGPVQQGVTTRGAARVVVVKRIEGAGHGARITLSAIGPAYERGVAERFLRQCRIVVPPGVARWATWNGTTNQHGSPIVPVTVVGPQGTANTWAEIDTGNESDTLITAALARRVGLSPVGQSLSCGIDGCMMVPIYQQVSITPQASANWMEWMGSAIRWSGSGPVGIDFGTQFLRHARLTLIVGHWTLDWRVSR